MALFALLGAGALARPGLAHAQTIRVTAESENFRAQPRGEVIATLERGVRLEDASRDGSWYRATLRGWIWAASVESAGRSNRLDVSAAQGENLRSSPNGPVLARVNRETVLTELARRDNWVQVERRAWVWAASAEVVPGGEAAAGPPAGQAQASAAATDVAASPATAARPAAGRPAASGDAAAPSLDWLRASGSGTALLESPDGDTLARVRPLAVMEVVAREGNWARVRMDGWVWQPGLVEADSGAILRDVGAAALAANPESFRGRVVEWRLQFISLERAERIRTDFYEGEPFILARGPGDEAAFVYVAVPPERVPRVERLGPLERIVVIGRVRTGRSRVMGAPVLDLLEFRIEAIE